MVRLDAVRSATSSLANSQPLVCAFVGGTSGIGEYTIRALAQNHSSEGEGLRVYIIGRNETAAEKIIADCSTICPKGCFKFVQVDDLSLMANVDLACSKITELERNEARVAGETPRLDMLVMSQACSVFQERKETKEGLDFLMSLMYYSRMRFIIQLLPLLLASTLTAHVVSVYAAGTESKLLLNDLSLRDPTNYGYFNARSHVCYMKTAFMEALADKYRGKLSLTHVFPGLVLTPAFNDPTLPFWFKLVWYLMAPISRLVALSPEDVGNRVLFLATPGFPPKSSSSDEVSESSNASAAIRSMVGTDRKVGSGAYSVGADSEVIGPTKALQQVDKADLIYRTWNHTMKAFEEIENGRKFCD